MKSLPMYLLSTILFSVLFTSCSLIDDALTPSPIIQAQLTIERSVQRNDGTESGKALCTARLIRYDHEVDGKNGGGIVSASSEYPSPMTQGSILLDECDFQVISDTGSFVWWETDSIAYGFQQNHSHHLIIDPATQKLKSWTFNPPSEAYSFLELPDTVAVGYEIRSNVYCTNVTIKKAVNDSLSLIEYYNSSTAHLFRYQVGQSDRGHELTVSTRLEYPTQYLHDDKGDDLRITCIMTIEQRVWVEE